MSKIIRFSLIILIISGLMGLFFLIFSNSIDFENNKARFGLYYSQAQNENDASELIKMLDQSQNIEYTNIFQNSKKLDLYLRYLLLSQSYDKSPDLSVPIKKYKDLLKFKPSWPYYYSGIAQLEKNNKVQRNKAINRVIAYGKHEKQTTQSIAEIFFSDWEKFTKEFKDKLMLFLVNQNQILMGQIVVISDQFAKLYEYCDYIHQKKQIEHTACIKRYWEPLSNSQL